MDNASTDRASVVSALWTFKSLCDSKRHLNLPMVHFKLMLADATYRNDILLRAEKAGDPALLAAVAKIRTLPIDGAIERSQQAAGAPQPQPSAPQLIPQDTRGSSHNPAILIAVALVAIIGLAYVLLVQVRAPKSVSDAMVEVGPAISEDTTWIAGTIYRLSGPTFVEPGVRLTVQAGVRVEGVPGAALVITRGGAIHARGRTDAPIVFTSAKPVGSRQPGDWGGVVMLGDAPVNRPSPQVEGLSGGEQRAEYGGHSINGSCGVLEYVRIEFAGYEISRDNELNGLTLAGCGSGTVIRHVQVHRGLDDGIEVFGGTVDLSHIVVSGAGDDAFDWDKGWRGRAQYVLLLMYPDIGDNGFEGDNDKKNPNAMPRSAPTFYNVTMLAEPSSTRVHRGMTLRRGSGGSFHNVIVSGFNREAIDLRGAAIQGLVDTRDLRFSGVLLHENGKAGDNKFDPESGEADDDGGFVEAAYFQMPRAVGVNDIGIQHRNLLANRAEMFVPQLADLPLAATPVPQEEFWDEGADFIGALRPGERDNWLLGWTDFPRN